MTKSTLHVFPGLVSLLCFAMLLFPSPGQGVTIHEYVTPSANSSPTGLAFDAGGHLWFTEINTDKIARLDPSQAEPGTSRGIVEFNLPERFSKPNDIIVARDGMVWFTEMGKHRIGRLDPGTGKIQEFAIPTPKSEPHNLVEAKDGSIWFVEFETNKIARLDPATGDIREFDVGPGHPHDLAIRGDTIWYSQGGKFWAKMFANKIGSLHMQTGKVKEITVPPNNSVPHGITLAGDGVLWFTQMFANKIARLDFSRGSSPAIVEYSLAGKRKGPHDIVIDDKRRWAWFPLNRAGSIGRLDLKQAQPGTAQGMEEFPIPTHGSHPNSVALDAEGNVWFTEMGHYFMGKYQNKVGKLIP
ncbi:MAG: Lyase-like protein [Nitrospinaceae bacterium]